MFQAYHRGAEIRRLDDIMVISEANWASTSTYRKFDGIINIQLDSDESWVHHESTDTEKFHYQ